MRSRPLRQHQRGYLLEVPLILMAVGILLAVLIPHLPPLGQKILLSIAALPVLFGLYYMIVIPGWTPNDHRRLKPIWRVLVFLMVAGLIVVGVAGFIFGG